MLLRKSQRPTKAALETGAVLRRLRARLQGGRTRVRASPIRETGSIRGSYSHLPEWSKARRRLPVFSDVLRICMEFFGLFLGFAYLYEIPGVGAGFSALFHTFPVVAGVSRSYPTFFEGPPPPSLLPFPDSRCWASSHPHQLRYARGKARTRD